MNKFMPSLILTILGMFALDGMASTMPDRWVFEELAASEGMLVPNALTDDGIVGGVAYLPDGQRPFIKQDDTLYLFTEAPVNMDIFPINEDGLGLAADRSSGRVFRYSTSGLEELTTLNNTPGVAIALTGFDAQGNFAGHYQDQANGFTAFAWNEVTGVEIILDDKLISLVTDINRQGAVLGHGYNTPSDVSKCFIYENGERRDFEDAVPDVMTTVMINNLNQALVLVQPANTPSQLSYRLVDTSDFSSVEINSFSNDSSIVGTLINDLGQAAFASGGGDEPAAVDLWSPGKPLVRLLTLENTAGLRLEEFTDSGTVRAHRFEGPGYNTKVFLASVESGQLNLNQRVVGYAEDEFMTVLSTALTNDGRLTVSFLRESDTQVRHGMFVPAKPGDVDGNGSVDVEDVLAIVSAWGPRPLNSVCGPDLDMNGLVDVSDLLETLDAWQ